ncbi:hypothetical protein H2204_015638, partial [Knufia peltigerae]
MADQSNHTPPPPTNPRVPQVALNNTATRPLRTLLPAPRGLDPDIEGSSQQGLAQAQGVRQHHEVENTARVVSMAKRTLTSAATSSTPDYMFVNPSDLIQPSTNGQDEDVIMDDALTGTGCLSNWDLPCGQPSCIFCGQRQGDAGGSSAGSQQVGNPPTPSSRTSPCPPPLDFTYIPEIDNYLFEPPSDTATELAYPSWIISEEDRQQYRTAMIARRIDERANPGPRGQQLQPGVDSTAASSSANQTQPVVPQTSSHPPVQSSAQNAQPQAANTQSSPPVPDNNSSPFVFMVTERELPLGYWKPHYALPGSIQFVPTKFSSDTTDKPSSVAAVEVDSVGNPLMDVYIITKDGKSLELEPELCLRHHQTHVQNNAVLVPVLALALARDPALLRVPVLVPEAILAADEIHTCPERPHGNWTSNEKQDASQENKNSWTEYVQKSGHNVNAGLPQTENGPNAENAETDDVDLPRHLLPGRPLETLSPLNIETIYISTDCIIATVSQQQGRQVLSK